MGERPTIVGAIWKGWGSLVVRIVLRTGVTRSG